MAGRNTTSEKVIERRLRKEVEALGGYCLKLPSQFIAGLPDRICLLPKGRVIFAETKSSGDNPSKIQLVWHRRLERLGFIVLVVDTVEKAENVKHFKFFI